MSTTKGLSIEDAQYMVCRGTYGGKTWSPQEEQAACDRYEQMTGQHLTSGYGHITLYALFFIILILAVTLYMLYFVNSNKSKAQKRHR